MSDIKVQQPDFTNRVHAYGINHMRAFISSLGRLYRYNFASLMTIAVIAIALALPTGFYVLLNNMNQISQQWDSPAKISLYLQEGITDTGINTIARQIQQDARIVSLEVINADQALEEFKNLSGFGAALDALDDNPLPSVIIVTPTVSDGNTEPLEILRQQLIEIDGVDQAKLDMQWLQRLFALLAIIEQAIFIIAAFLGLAVILTIGNTIRLDIQSRKEEIIVQKLIGATNAFIRRPFLYTGIWYGLLSGLLAWFLISASLEVLDQPIKQLASLYNSFFSLKSLSLKETGMFFCIAIGLGFIGSWLAVARHLSQIEPQ